jgi:phosphate transport system ATP-binding protein
MDIHRMKKNKRAYKEAVQHYLELAGLWDEVGERLNHPATALSIGQQQRLCLARGLAIEPAVILADEPTSALDPISSQHIERKLLELKEQYTTVVVTHTLRQAKRLGNYVIYMYMGEVIETGPAQEVFNNPQQERTQQYLQGIF